MIDTADTLRTVVATPKARVGKIQALSRGALDGRTGLKVGGSQV